MAARAGSFTFETTEDLASLEESWTLLAERSDNVFATFEWLATWWRHFGRDRQLLLATVWADRPYDDRSADDRPDGRPGAAIMGDEPLAILPLYVAVHRPVRVIRLLGHGPTDQLGPICAAADQPLARQALAAFLTGPSAPPWDLAIADELPAGGGPVHGARVLARHPTHIVRLGDTTTPAASPGTATSGDAWFATRSPNLRSQLARAARRLDQQGTVTTRVADDPATVDHDLDLLLDLHRRRWAAQGGSRSFTGREAFHHDIARRFLDRGWLRLRFLEVDGTAVAANLSYRFDGVESHYQSGRDPAFDPCSVGLLLHEHAIRSCADEGVREYRFLRGDEAYKRRFADRTVDQESVAWSRGPLGSRAMAAVAQLPRLSRTQARWVPAPLAWGTGGSPRWGPP